MDHERWMRAALEVAQGCATSGDVPVGAAIVKGDDFLATGGNRREADQDPTAHAEIVAIRAAAAALGNWHLDGCTLYVTLEPCAMCAGAIVLARLGRLVYGAPDPKAGACGSVLDVIHERRLNHRVTVESGVLAEECGAPLKEFFAKKRRAAEEKAEPGRA